MFCFPFSQFTTIISIFFPVTHPFHFEYNRNEQTETAPDSPKIDVTAKSISQELKVFLKLHLHAFPKVWQALYRWNLCLNLFLLAPRTRKEF